MLIWLEWQIKKKRSNKKLPVRNKKAAKNHQQMSQLKNRDLIETKVFFSLLSLFQTITGLQAPKKWNKKTELKGIETQRHHTIFVL